jgi:uncharacterized protein DUF222/HNH endonuclease
MLSLASDTDRLGDEIAELAAHLDAATYRLLTLIRRFDDGGGWAAHGALSCAHWLSWRVGLDLGAAREHVRVARALAALPLIDGALRTGQVSYSKVRALTRVATAANEAALLEMARSATASQLERICRGYRRVLRNAAEVQPDDEAETRWVRERETEAGLVRFDIQLRPEEAAVVRRALEAAQSRAAGDASAETRAVSLRRADALVALCETYLSGASDGEAGPPVEIVLHVEPEGGCLDDGTALPPPTVERLACDAAVVEVVEDFRGNVLDVGRRRRTIPTLLRRALRLRDRGCRFPGCTNRRVDGHHLMPWAAGGETTLANLCSLCRRHHTAVHEQGFRLESAAAGGFRFFDPQGRELPPIGERPLLPPTAVEELRAQTRAAGIAIDATTSLPLWDGSRPDYDQIVWCLASRQGEGVTPGERPA